MRLSVANGSLGAPLRGNCCDIMAPVPWRLADALTQTSPDHDNDSQSGG